jgi:hypothetical protein
MSCFKTDLVLAYSYNILLFTVLQSTATVTMHRQVRIRHTSVFPSSVLWPLIPDKF